MTEAKIAIEDKFRPNDDLVNLCEYLLAYPDQWNFHPCVISFQQLSLEP